MTPSVEKLLFAAASGFADPEERRAFLDHACDHDPKLRSRLDELLEIQSAADTFFEFQPDVEPRGKRTEQAEEEVLGARIGPYRLIKRIGAGGYGVVYLAEQEEPVRRKVALKIVKLGMDTDAVIARFALERQALALMDHPNIARVLDAGATVSGRPYFVMELVEGEKITDFCDAHGLDIRHRLVLFAQVCQAIQHAHQKGVIHRDIKPSNVLVREHDGEPVPKVIDFGIAKATAEGAAADATATHFQQFLGTPAYMSPEQAQGGVDVDTRSDIYSLGVLLYELLGGRPPFDLLRLKECGMEEVRRILREEDPKPPSETVKAAAPGESAVIAANRGTTPQHLVSELAGDLDWIVAKAMEKERARRYDTANGLAFDVRRHLTNEPVLARPRSRAYLLGKMVRRNKLVFAAGSVAVFGLFAGFGTSTWMYLREREALQEQSRLRQRAEFRGQIAQAAVKVSYGDLAAADELLAQVPIEHTFSSLEAANAFRAVAEWHVQAGRLKEAASRFTAMVRALSSVDSSDLPSISFQLLPAAAAVAYSSGAEPYEELRRMAIERFGGTAHLAVAEQTLKACLLRPADKETLQSLAPMAAFIQQGFEKRHGTIDNNPHFCSWICLSLAMMHYRTGEYPEAIRWADEGLGFKVENQARTAALFIVRAMAEQESGQPGKARMSLDQGSGTVRDIMANQKWVPPMPGPAYWFDWIIASILQSEAERSIGSK